MLIHYVSDLHLEGLQGRADLTGVRPIDGCGALVLAGDIVELRQTRELLRLVEPFVQRAIPVLYVPGNHEYYRTHVPMPDRTRTDLEAIQGLHLLDDRAVVIDGVRFVGSTLWSPLKPVEQGIAIADDAELSYHLSDFGMIRCGNDKTPMTPARMRAIHRQSWSWLRDTLQEPHAGPTVVITHFVPSPDGIAPQFIGSNLNGYFVADCRALMNPSIAVWIAGHTHGSFNRRDQISGVQLVCNPHGYLQRGQRENPDFVPLATVRIG